MTNNFSLTNSPSGLFAPQVSFLHSRPLSTVIFAINGGLNDWAIHVISLLFHSTFSVYQKTTPPSSCYVTSSPSLQIRALSLHVRLGGCFKALLREPNDTYSHRRISPAFTGGVKKEKRTWREGDETHRELTACWSTSCISRRLTLFMATLAEVVGTGMYDNRTLLMS